MSKTQLNFMTLKRGLIDVHYILRKNYIIYIYITNCIYINKIIIKDNINIVSQKEP